MLHAPLLSLRDHGASSSSALSGSSAAAATSRSRAAFGRPLPAPGDASSLAARRRPCARRSASARRGLARRAREQVVEELVQPVELGGVATFASVSKNLTGHSGPAALEASRRALARGRRAKQLDRGKLRTANLGDVVARVDVERDEARGRHRERDRAEHGLERLARRAPAREEVDDDERAPRSAAAVAGDFRRARARLAAPSSLASARARGGRPRPAARARQVQRRGGRAAGASRPAPAPPSSSSSRPNVVDALRASGCATALAPCSTGSAEAARRRASRTPCRSGLAHDVMRRLARAAIRRRRRPRAARGTVFRRAH